MTDIKRWIPFWLIGLCPFCAGVPTGDYKPTAVQDTRHLEKEAATLKSSIESRLCSLEATMPATAKKAKRGTNIEAVSASEPVRHQDDKKQKK